MVKTAQKKLATIEKQMNESFPERREVIRAMLVSYVAGEHTLILGPPGTGKSLMANAFAKCVAGGSYFEHLMTKFTVPEEIFGPVKFSSLKNDEYERSFKGYAPECKVWFLDEIWKSSSAILNALLKSMQEREIRNGANMVKLPMEMVIAASNEYPQDDSLQALFDRFSTKFWVEYMSDPGNVISLWENGGNIKPITATIDCAEVKSLREDIDKIKFTKANIETLSTIKSAVENEGFVASDRTWMKALKLIKSSAVVSGRSSITGSDFSILANMLWKEHKDRIKLHELVGNAADPYGSRAEAIVDGIKTALGEIPDVTLLKTAKIGKVEFVAKLGSVNGMLGSESDKITDLADEAKDNPAVKDAAKKLDEAIEKVDGIMRFAMKFRESKNV